MKRVIAIFLVLCMVLTACDKPQSQTETKPHTHTPADWGVAPMEHWYTCSECGEMVVEAHNTDADGFCEGCTLTICDNEDGTFNLMGYDMWGGLAIDLWMTETGTVMSELRYENEYDDKGNVLHGMTYVDGVLASETFYEVGDVHYMSQEISYDETGKTVTSYNEHMYATGAAVYNAQGNLISEEEYVYEYDDVGNVIYTASYVGGELTFENAEMMGPDGNMYTRFIRYYGSGELVGEFSHEYEFSDDGNLALVRDFVDGVLAVIGTYELDPDGISYLAMEECYDENGEITDVYYYDLDGNFIEK